MKEGLVDFRSIGAICSTSKAVARAMAPKIPVSDPPKVIVELGVGTGNITEEILRHLRPQDMFIGIEQSENLLEVCRENLCIGDKNISVRLEHGLAQDLHTILRKYHITAVDDIVCTIPFRVLPKRETRHILEEVRRVIQPGGHFSFIRLLPALETSIIYEILSDFSVVHKKLVMRNIPPAEVVIMRKGVS